MRQTIDNRHALDLTLDTVAQYYAYPKLCHERHGSQAISHSALSESGERLRFLPLFKNIKCCHFIWRLLQISQHQNLKIFTFYLSTLQRFSWCIRDDSFMIMTHIFSAFDTHFKESESRFEWCPRRLRGSGQDVKLRNIVMAPCIPSRR